ncbi:MAG: tetratricopeptide repeat protein [Bacteroidota bacterium]
MATAITGYGKKADSLEAAFAGATGKEQKADIAYELAKLSYGTPAMLRYGYMGYGEVATLTVVPRVNMANVIGAYYMLQGQYDSALKYYNIAMATAKTLNNQELVAKVKGNLGELASKKGDYSVALKYQLEVLGYYERELDTLMVVRQNVNIGNTYSNMHDHTKALQYYNKAYPLLKDSRNKLAGNLFNSMAVSYGELKDTGKEGLFLQRSLDIKTELDDSAGIANTLFNIACVKQDHGLIDEAIQYNKRALSMAEQMDNEGLAAKVYINLGVIYAGNKHDYPTAIQYYTKALAKADKNDDLQERRNALAGLYSCYVKTGDYKSAFSYWTRYDVVKDSVLNSEAVDRVAEAETRYATQATERENERLQYENTLNAIARKKAESDGRLAIVISIGVLAAGSLIAYLIYRNRRAMVKVREEQLMGQALYEGEQQERIRIARDLHDSIGQMLSVVKMQLSDPGSAQTSPGANTAALVDKAIKEVRTISHNLIPEEISFGIVKGIDELCDTINAANGVAVSFEASDNVKQMRFAKQVEVSLYRVVQEVLGNMLKHANATKIDISMYNDGPNVAITLADNGEGFATSRIQGSAGIGWKNIFARVKFMNGAMNITSGKGTGTQILITLPHDRT